MAELKEQVWASGADVVEEATDMAAAKSTVAAIELETEKTEEELAVQKAEKEQAADKEMERIRGLGIETDAALAELPEGTIVVYPDGGYIKAADPADDKAGFGWSATHTGSAA